MSNSLLHPWHERFLNLDRWSRFEKEIECLVRKLQLKFFVGLVLFAVNDEVFRVTTSNLA
jgi:hypothetical protein